MPDVSVCFLGTGRINARHIQTLKQLRPQARIAVASRDKHRARAFGDRHGARDSYGSYEDAIASDYDTIVIGVPPSAHRSLVELALAAGKHLLIEKPVFASFDELEALWPRLSDIGPTVMVAENLHYAPFHRRLKHLLGQKGLGQPLLLDLTRLVRARPPAGAPIRPRCRWAPCTKVVSTGSGASWTWRRCSTAGAPTTSSSCTRWRRPRPSPPRPARTR